VETNDKFGGVMSKKMVFPRPLEPVGVARMM
jgi:hypothetical protein